MSAKSMRNFSRGLLVASSICGVVYFFGPNQVETAEKKLSKDEMKSSLTAEGYVVLTKAEWDEQLTALENAEKQATETTDKNKVEPETPATPSPNDKVVYRTMLYVASGMTPYDAGAALVQAQIIPNALEFSTYVESRGLATALRPGTYEIHSGMSMDEIIDRIFKI